jgi:hypothetical protein
MARRRASRRAAAAWLALALAFALCAPRCAAAGEGDAEELAALAATKARHEQSRFTPDPAAPPPQRGGGAPKPHAKEKTKSTPQQRLAIAILTLKSAFVEPNVNSNDAVCNPDDAPDPCHCASRHLPRPRAAPARAGAPDVARRGASRSCAGGCVGPHRRVLRGCAAALPTRVRFSPRRAAQT